MKHSRENIPEEMGLFQGLDQQQGS